jgi:peptidoglycan/xylan/chitin deacetylase (PgdA/CDA1 family)
VLAYHNIVPDDAMPFGDRSLHLPLASFRRQVLRLRATHEVVPLDRVGAAATRGRPLAAITFDDAYAGALELALPLLADLQLPACIFVAPGLLGTASAWWDRLADPLKGLAPSIRDHVLEALHGDNDAALAWARTSGAQVRDPGPLARFATEQELLRAAALPGVLIGCHSWSHPNLATLDESRISEELTRSTEWLARHLTCYRPLLAYPYGRSSAVAEACAARIGIRHAYRIEGGRVRDPATAPMALPRLNVPAGMTARGLELRTSGLLGG